MNPHTNRPTSFYSLLYSIWRHKSLIMRMTKREVIGRYKGSVIGLGWSFFSPIIMLAVYTFVFSVVFKARWGSGNEENKAQFAVILFTGLMIYNFFAEVLNRSPGLLLENINYVKKVIFPLEILSIVSMGTAAFHLFISLFILLTAFFFLNGYIHLTSLLILVVFFPLALITLAFSWLLASLGVYLRDIAQVIGIMTTMIMFLTPIFYPIAALPETYQTIILLNPLTFLVEEGRRILIWGEMPNWKGLAIYLVFSFLLVWFGYWWFQKTRKGFSDII